MQINETIKIGNNNYIVLEQCGEGGQGAVWKVKEAATGKIWALKILSEKNADRRRNKINNIHSIINEKLDERLRNADAQFGINHVFPIAKYNNSLTGDTGYLMEFVSGKQLGRMLADGTVSGMNLEGKLKLLVKVARAVDMLHAIGYCYTDISFGNFMYNEASDTLAVIDCENISSKANIQNGKCAFLKGTGFFVAPEVAFNDKKTSYATDRYALATLIFCFITENGIPSPYHGVAMYSAVPACADMLEVAEYEEEEEIDKNWRHFVFDKNNRSNGLDNLVKNSKNPENQKLRRKVERVMAIWKTLPAELKELFHKAFDDPFGESSRPIASLWVRVMEGVLNGAHNAPAVAAQNANNCPAPAAANNGHNAPAVAANNVQPAVAVQHANNKPVAAAYSGAYAAEPEQKRKMKQFPPEHKKSQKTYEIFVPRGQSDRANGKDANIQPAVSGPCLTGAGGRAVEIAAPVMTIDGQSLGLIQKQIGTLEKTADGYTFISGLQTVVEIKAPNGAVKARLGKGQSAKLCSGDMIKPMISTVPVTIKF